jgi:hypothetical protein
MTDTVDAANEVLIAGTLGYPEMDDQEEIDELTDIGIFNYAKINIIDVLGTPEFKNTYLNLIDDINLFSFEYRRIFCQKLLEKVFEVYDFQFSEKIDLTSDYDLDSFLKFIEFIEYDNVDFLSLIWEMMKADIMKIDIEVMCKENENKIIKEIEEHIETNDQPRMIALFLRTYYKERFIEWFIRESEKSKVEIKLKILEREEKLNAQY